MNRIKYYYCLASRIAKEQWNFARQWARSLKPEQIVSIVTAIFIILLFFLWGPPMLYEKSSSPEYCSSCHVMEAEHNEWFKTGMHRSVKCVDCHLPNDNYASHLIWKGIDGSKDLVFFYGRLFPERINISHHGKEVVQQNCVRCHEGLVWRVSESDRPCWSCHRRANHRYNARILSNSR